MSMCLNNYVDSAVKNNWSGFAKSTVKIKDSVTNGLSGSG